MARRNWKISPMNSIAPVLQRARSSTIPMFGKPLPMSLITIEIPAAQATEIADLLFAVGLGADTRAIIGELSAANAILLANGLRNRAAAATIREGKRGEEWRQIEALPLEEAPFVAPTLESTPETPHPIFDNPNFCADGPCAADCLGCARTMASAVVLHGTIWVQAQLAARGRQWPLLLEMPAPSREVCEASA